MTTKRKTPASLVEILANQQRAVAYTTESLYVKANIPIENQSELIRNASKESIIAFMEGMNAMLEQVLTQFNCYVGFYYQKSSGLRLNDISSPDFAEWRRNYLVRTN